MGKLQTKSRQSSVRDRAESEVRYPADLIADCQAADSIAEHMAAIKLLSESIQAKQTDADREQQCGGYYSNLATGRQP